MPDITMCMNHNCRKKSKCYRFMAEGNRPYQSYAFFEDEDKEDCFIKINKKKDNNDR